MPKYHLPQILSRTAQVYDDNSVLLVTISRGKAIPAHYPLNDDVCNLLTDETLVADELWFAGFKDWAAQPLDDQLYISMHQTCTAYEETYAHRATTLENACDGGTYINTQMGYGWIDPVPSQQ